MHSSVELFPSIHAGAVFEASAVAHAHKSGINPVELDALAQAIGRLARDHSTVVPMSMREDLLEFEKLGYVELTNTPSATITVELLCAGALLSSYFWSVWVPRYLQCCSLKVAFMSHLQHPAEVQHCSVVFRVPGAREATRHFLHELGTKFPGDQAEIIAIQTGNVLADRDAEL